VYFQVRVCNDFNNEYNVQRCLSDWLKVESLVDLFMPKYGIHFVVLIIAVMLSAVSKVLPGTWRLEKGGDFKEVSADSDDKFIIAVAEAKRFVDTGQKGAARWAYDELKQGFPEIDGPDFDLFVKAEIFYCTGQFAKAVKTYNKLLTEYPKSKFSEAALDREFAVATAYLGGRKKTLLGFIKIKGYAEGIRFMEKITDRVGLDTQLGIKASIAVAENYEERKKFNEAFLKWWEISLEWEMGPVGAESLLGMARCKLAVYNKPPEHKRPFYDASPLRSAKTYYGRYKLLYPKDAKEIGVDEILSQIDEELANKQLSIGRYYHKTGNKQAANLYFNMVVSDWPDSKAAQEAKELLAKK
jgi:tetratricopeptide (TPR) repeat protein